jgi:hypothetical protein
MEPFEQGFLSSGRIILQSIVIELALATNKCRECIPTEYPGPNSTQMKPSRSWLSPFLDPTEDLAMGFCNGFSSGEKLNSGDGIKTTQEVHWHSLIPPSPISDGLCVNKDSNPARLMCDIILDIKE